MTSNPRFHKSEAALQRIESEFGAEALSYDAAGSLIEKWTDGRIKLAQRRTDDISVHVRHRVVYEGRGDFTGMFRRKFDRLRSAATRDDPESLFEDGPQCQSDGGLIVDN